MPEQSTFQKVIKSERQTRDTKAKEKRGEYEWYIHGSGEEEYSKRFFPVFHRTIRSYLQERENQGKQNRVLDVMADTGFAFDVRSNAAYGLAVGAADTRNILKRAIDSVLFHTEMLEGDVLTKRTWRGIKKKLHAQRNYLAKFGKEIDVFNLITCTPAGGALSLTTETNVHFWLMQQAYHLLSNDNGVLLTTISVGNPEHVREWVDEINQANVGIYMDMNEGTEETEPALLLVKGPHAPANLPPLKRLSQHSI